MKTFVNHMSAVKFEIQTLLFAFSVVMHTTASAISPAHPRLGVIFMLLEIVGWICIGQIWAFELIKGIQQWGPKIWSRIWTLARMHGRGKKVEQPDTFVPVEQLELVRHNVQRLGLALHGLTPEMETARRTHFQMLGEALPSLILPPQNALLGAEFDSLVKLLNHFGFPSLERVQLQQKEFAFIQQWGQDLEARLLHSHTQLQKQHQAMHSALSTATQVHQSIGTMYPAALNDAGYQRIQGALKLLKKMAQNSHCPSELVASYIPALQHDMDTLLTQLQQAAA